MDTHAWDNHSPTPMGCVCGVVKGHLEDPTDVFDRRLEKLLEENRKNDSR